MHSINKKKKKFFLFKFCELAIIRRRSSEMSPLNFSTFFDWVSWLFFFFYISMHSQRYTLLFLDQNWNSYLRFSFHVDACNVTRTKDYLVFVLTTPTVQQVISLISLVPDWMKKSSCQRSSYQLTYDCDNRLRGEF